MNPNTLTNNQKKQSFLSSLPSVVIFIIALWLICYILIILIFKAPGYTTASLWNKKSEWKTELVATAKGVQIYGEKPRLLTKFDAPEIRIFYENGKTINENNKSLPREKGCIIVKNMSSSHNFLVGVDYFLRSTSNLRVHSITTVVAKRQPLKNIRQSDYDRQHFIRLGMSFKQIGFSVPKEKKITNIDSSWATREEDSIYRVGSFKKAKAPILQDKFYPLDKYIYNDSLDVNETYFFVGGPSGGGPPGIAQVSFIEQISAGEFKPLLPKNKIPFVIKFVDYNQVENYKNSKNKRLLLTIPAIAFDVLTSPFQLFLILTAGVWMPA